MSFLEMEEDLREQLTVGRPIASEGTMRMEEEP
jgi:hypothetical protein